MVDFHGWMMPLHYGSQIDEHHAVRTDAGMFDVSHMTIVDLRGSRTRSFCVICWRTMMGEAHQKRQSPLLGDVECLWRCDDDLIVYYFTEDFFRPLLTPPPAKKDLSWITQHAEPFGIEITVRDDLP